MKTSDCYEEYGSNEGEEANGIQHQRIAHEWDGAADSE
jgi:hypothetical protein